MYFIRYKTTAMVVISFHELLISILIKKSNLYKLFTPVTMKKYMKILRWRRESAFLKCI